MANSFVQLPLDTSNAGKKQRTNTRVVGSDTVHESYVIPVYPKDILGLYYGSSDPQTVLQTAHSSTTGFVYAVNPIGSGITMAVRRVKVVCSPIDTNTRTNAPIIRLERFTFTGTPSGASIAPAKRTSTDATNVGSLRLADTGMTITAGPVIRRYIVPLVPSGAQNVNNPVEYIWEPLGDEGEMLLLPGEGVVLRQQTNGDSGDTRIIFYDHTWLEY